MTVADPSQEKWRDHARDISESLRAKAVLSGAVAGMKQLPDKIRIARSTGSEAVEIDVAPIVYAVLDVVADGLATSIECVLLDHVDELAGAQVDANLAELAFVYGRLTGFNAGKEAARG
jgi:hypothetical protein